MDRAFDAALTRASIGRGDDKERDHARAVSGRRETLAIAVLIELQDRQGRKLRIQITTLRRRMKILAGLAPRRADVNQGHAALGLCGTHEGTRERAHLACTRGLEANVRTAEGRMHRGTFGGRFVRRIRPTRDKGECDEDEGTRMHRTVLPRTLSATSVSCTGMLRLLRLHSLLALSSLAIACTQEPTFRVAASQRTHEAPSAPTFVAAAEPSRDGWNRTQIEWVSHEEALRRAEADHRPICIVMHADWCGHCHNYMHVFEDPRIVERAHRMHMVLLDVDAEPAIASRYASDGGYVPRTYFAAADGSILPVDAHRPRFQHFFHESDPTSLLTGMDEALAR